MTEPDRKRISSILSFLIKKLREIFTDSYLIPGMIFPHQLVENTPSRGNGKDRNFIPSGEKSFNI